MQRKLYLVCYDIPEPKRQRLFRYVVKRLSVSGQYSAYECWLIQSERQKLVNFMLSKAILGEDACAIVRVGSVCQYIGKTCPNHPFSTPHTIP